MLHCLTRLRHDDLQIISMKTFEDISSGIGGIILVYTLASYGGKARKQLYIRLKEGEGDGAAQAAVGHDEAVDARDGHHAEAVGQAAEDQHT